MVRRILMAVATLLVVLVVGYAYHRTNKNNEAVAQANAELQSKLDEAVKALDDVKKANAKKPGVRASAGASVNGDTADANSATVSAIANINATADIAMAGMNARNRIRQNATTEIETNDGSHSATTVSQNIEMEAGPGLGKKMASEGRAEEIRATAELEAAKAEGLAKVETVRAKRVHAAPVKIAPIDVNVNVSGTVSHKGTVKHAGTVDHKGTVTIDGKVVGQIKVAGEVNGRVTGEISVNGLTKKYYQDACGRWHEMN